MNKFNPNQKSLFGLPSIEQVAQAKRKPTAKQLRDQGIELAEDNANERWKVAALECVYSVCCDKKMFTADDVVDCLKGLDVETHEMRAMGGVMKKAQKKEWCKPTKDFTICKRKNCHAMPRRIWESLVFEQFES